MKLSNANNLVDNYTGFADFYDEFMDDIPYDDWSCFIVSKLKEHKIDSGIVCELGCGTGEITKRLQKAGYDMIGIDLSEDMLSVAMNKFYDEEISGIMLLNQDMRSFELYGTVDAIVSICDSLNYITEPEDLLKVFKLVNNYLEKDGLFIFDLKTDYFYRTDYADGEFSDEAEDAILRWKNHYDTETKLNHYEVEIEYAYEDGEDKFTESHVQRAYSKEEITSLIEQSGMKLLEMIDYDTMDVPTENSRRIFVIASEGFQKGKHYTGE